MSAAKQEAWGLQLYIDVVSPRVSSMRLLMKHNYEVRNQLLLALDERVLLIPNNGEVTFALIASTINSLGVGEGLRTALILRPVPHCKNGSEQS